MRKTLLALALAIASCAHQRPATITGWVSDAHCTVEHVGGKNASCVRKCIKGGASVGHPEWTAQAMVLVVEGSNRVLVVDNPETLTGREAQRVTVVAEITGERLHVVSVKS